jgi:hypothetical protein
MKIVGMFMILLLAACAIGERRSSGEDELARELAGRVAGEPRACISPTSDRALVPVGRQTLIYREGRRIWVNRLRSECPGVRPHSTLIVETFSGRFCRGDRVRGLEPGTTIPGPVCVLGEFVPYARP